MKKLLLIFGFFLIPIVSANQGTIFLHKTNETDNEVVFVLEAKDIQSDLIGISANLLLPDGISFKDYGEGNFFEEEAEEVTYLIAPKSNKPNELMIGIVTLGESEARGNGTIVYLTLSKASPTTTTIPQIIEAKVSGVVDQKRIDYEDVLWQVDATLPQTGPTVWHYFIIITGFPLLLRVLGRIFL